MSVSFAYKERYGVEDLCKIMALLRSEEGCPWDRVQTHESIRKNFIEETYEAIEAIDLKDYDLMREELGDVLLQVVFHARMEEEAGRFDFQDVADGICKKLIERHPHIFSDVQADTAGEVLKNWDEIKKRKKGQNTQSEVMQSVSRALPSLMRSAKVQQKAAKVGFDWPNEEGALCKLEEEVCELREAVSSGDRAAAREELGDVLFSAVNVSRFLDADAEETLTGACDKFIARFERVEALAKEQGHSMQELTLKELDALWDEAKKAIHQAATQPEE